MENTSHQNPQSTTMLGCAGLLLLVTNMDGTSSQIGDTMDELQLEQAHPDVLA